MTQAKGIMDDALDTAIHAKRTMVVTTLGSTPGALAFSRDMFLNVPIVAEWQKISCKHEHHVNENLRKANAKRWYFDYAEGQKVLKKVHNPKSLEYEQLVLIRFNVCTLTETLQLNCAQDSWSE